MLRVANLIGTLQSLGNDHAMNKTDKIFNQTDYEISLLHTYSTDIKFQPNTQDVCYLQRYSLYTL